MQLDGLRIVLGVSGGIAAYKSPDLVRRLREAGAEVRVVLTAGALAFVQPLTFQAVSHRPVHTELLDPEAEAGMGHIELARWADLILVAPASADLMARLAHGHADDLLTTLCLASEAPLVLAPAMNHVMWRAAATRDNAERLTARGVRLLGPAEGPLAEGESGPGRLLEPREIVALLAGDGPLRGERVLITAGPTREAIDPVRFIGNRSSGRMGFAVAAAAARAGAKVVLVAGPCSLATPGGVERVDVESAREMHEAVMQRAGDCDIFIATAAVADYRVDRVPEQKIKKSDQPVALTLVPNPDILQAVAGLPRAPFTVGFAAETERLAEYAEAKRARKGLDMIAANLVGGGRDTGFDSADNALEVFWAGGHRSLPRAPKIQLAEALVALIAERRHGNDQTTDSRPASG
ncbi:bifunctional phosphopantothenoylcysteine decarboxylase/phosphopantothenate--cysteine ligase CoaBC [Sediminicurvatus halobius]|uniref:Coenzyme A biosynthesis bifunctional protein CoaBC n=1 Tax=Sediminicurvatus halobius TaxID=2182432 RepID=A0A2U2N232_9GAMM|nr:bifunctional phosphopantothenoylcysteine decarboxylase/phosphopantothenate--cysteine ligase CoaBC [Spiribacter halobius]PWG63108.1 bifunctional phosphopantothenoylcysteine decarboxylase/phosphopantothenate--cysteine ligase CoaBC [Spiribacter halobius]UEX77558.1 bifunctional phosphopantothenoylcysteine decarboxylase/phosphopantothenate--cysteine ligase CoaBC [Spiribacter halobius]